MCHIPSLGRCSNSTSRASSTASRKCEQIKTKTSLSTPTGAVAGGASIRVFGANSSFQTPRVFFDEIECPSLSVLTDAQLDAILPAGKIKVNLASPNGTFQVGDTLRGQLSNAHAEILAVSPTLAVGTIMGTFQAGEPVKADAGPTGTFQSLDGSVDVRIEGDFGTHANASTLQGGFSFE